MNVEKREIALPIRPSEKLCDSLSSLEENLLRSASLFVVVVGFWLLSSPGVCPPAFPRVIPGCLSVARISRERGSCNLGANPVFCSSDGLPTLLSKVSPLEREPRVLQLSS